MIGAVVLAAGRGSRFGYPPKLLADIGGARLVDRSLEAVDAAPVRPVVVVTGPRPSAIAARARAGVHPRARLRIVRNRAFRHGMAGSLRLGLAALPARCEAALICLADMPEVDARLATKLCRAWHGGLDYVRPMHNARPGHPVVIARALFAALQALDADQGAKPILDRVPAARRCHLPWSRAALADTDTPAALRRARAARRVRSSPR